jgi:hypothetical protein
VSTIPWNCCNWMVQQAMNLWHDVKLRLSPQIIWIV